MQVIFYEISLETSNSQLAIYMIHRIAMIAFQLKILHKKNTQNSRETLNLYHYHDKSILRTLRFKLYTNYNRTLPYWCATLETSGRAGTRRPFAQSDFTFTFAPTKIYIRPVCSLVGYIGTRYSIMCISCNLSVTRELNVGR